MFAEPGPPPDAPMYELVAVGTVAGLLAGTASCRAVLAVRPVIAWVWLGMLAIVAVTFSVPYTSPMTRGVRPCPAPCATGTRPCRLGN